MASPPLLWNGKPGQDRPTIVLAHGAGTPMDSAFMNFFSEHLAAAGNAVARFEFPYMQRRRADSAPPARRDAPSVRPGPDPAALLQETWRRVIAALDADGISRRALIIGGKSLGGRMASVVADDEGVLGLVCLGYPFHPPGKPTTIARIEHLRTLATPALIVQGRRDMLGSADDVAAYVLSPAIRMHWLTDGDHSFKPCKSSGRSERQNLDEGVAAVAAFVQEVAATPRAL